MRLTLLIMLISYCPALLAQPSIYQNGVLSIPQGAVQTGDSSVYFENIQLQEQADGSFLPIAAEPRDLVSVETVLVNVMESLPVQVSVDIEGNKSVPCVSLLTPAINYSDGVFTVTLAESELGPAETCIAVIDPFSTSVELDVAGLAAGDYLVRVNGVEQSFTLANDN
jgi:hypothetical protein